MEALRTKIDGLQWEVHRLDAENRKLRAGKPELGERLDLAAELEQAKGDVAELMRKVTNGRSVARSSGPTQRNVELPSSRPGCANSKAPASERASRGRRVRERQNLSRNYERATQAWKELARN